MGCRVGVSESGGYACLGGFLGVDRFYVLGSGLFDVLFLFFCFFLSASSGGGGVVID